MAVLTMLSLNTIEEGDISNERSEPSHTSKSQVSPNPLARLG